MLRLLIVSYYQTSVENQTTVRSFNLTRIKGDLVMKLLNNAVIRLTKNRKPAYDSENELMWELTIPAHGLSLVTLKQKAIN